MLMGVFFYYKIWEVSMKTITIFEKNFKEKNINKIIIKYINFKSILLCF